GFLVGGLFERLRTQREWLETALTSIGDAVIAVDPQARITFMNAVAEKLTGWTETEARRQPLGKVFVLLNETTRAKAENPVVDALKTGKIKILPNHTLVVSRRGVETSVENSAAPIKDTVGRITGAIVVCHDVTERCRVERALAKNQERLALALESGNVGI